MDITKAEKILLIVEEAEYLVRLLEISKGHEYFFEIIGNKKCEKNMEKLKGAQ